MAYVFERSAEESPSTCALSPVAAMIRVSGICRKTAIAISSGDFPNS